MIEVLERVSKKLGVKLEEKQVQRVVKEFIAKTAPSVNLEGKVLTFDGSWTIVSKEYKEPYHSITAGALKETIEKFIKPSGIEELAKRKKVINIIDVGFGLGYNVAVALGFIKKENPNCEVEIYSFEKHVLESIPILPEPFSEIHKKILDSLPSFSWDGVNFNLLLGDARETIQKLENFGAHVVFHDGFSPYRNPELWTYHFLERIKNLMHESGIWVSYTSALPVRKALKLLGFGLSTTLALGRKRSGTLAKLGGSDNLPSQELQKLEISPYAIPFEDPCLCLDREEIIIRYLIKVELNRCRST